MSDCYKIACIQCKVTRWIGQESRVSGEGYLYQDEIEPLWTFLKVHQGHRLLFDRDEAFTAREWLHLDAVEEEKAIDEGRE